MTFQTDLFGNLSLEQKDKPLSFKDWQLREGNVLYRCGASQMSNTHLLAHLLRDQRLAESLMEHFGSILEVAEASVVELSRVKGVNPAKAETIHVAFELSRRIAQPTFDTKPSISHPGDVYRLLKAEYRGLEQEVLKVLLLDTKNGVKRIETVFVGSLNVSIIHPREIFKAAIRQSAAAIIISHNHPSGSAQPSREDIAATKNLQKAGELVEIKLLDHVIIGNEEYVSLREEGLI